jgi:hypothetical protein
MKRPGSGGPYVQLVFVFEWPAPRTRVRVRCSFCGWRGQRTVHIDRPCPWCHSSVLRRVVWFRS